MLTIQDLLDEKKCYEIIRQIRWEVGVDCPHCDSDKIKKRGKSRRSPFLQRYHCKTCHQDFDDLTHTIFSKRHQSLKIWVACLYLMGLNLSNQQIAREIDLEESDVYRMTSRLREGIVEKSPSPQLEDEVECDEVYIVAGHKGHPEAVKKKLDKGEGTDSREQEGEEL